ncbi:chorismate synthase [Anaerocolumna chitinilytica]|uniref:Chorismate synthase n=1 Tax=Anaerocolumna chitinilytica TaxID=1727145 RepID=A0A7I8DRR3_9FIRM|nr:chorismate synthase [Anaerocolumna chitinilytica]BCK00388.1 chorismate synthase [Anaerocolumna chitinilytica]
MAGSTFGSMFRITTWGESHGDGIGVVIDGCPAGLSVNEEMIQAFLDRRRPGQTRYTTQRKEADTVKILSGIFEGKTTGTPISMAVMNTNQISRDYSEIAGYYRPGHADYTYDTKYGFRDYRGGGRSSGRETIGRVAAGAIASAILKELGITVCAYTKSIGGISIDYSKCSKENIFQSPFYMPDLEASAATEVLMQEKIKELNSVGGIIECIISGVPAGIGEPVFEKLDANLGKAILSIGAIKGIEFGSGFLAAEKTGIENNDPYFYSETGKVEKRSNNAGGILGGISDGSEIVFRAAVKPTASIAMNQKTINKEGENIDIRIKGRHDPVIVPRAVVVVESMAAVTLLDMLFQSMTSRMDSIVKFFRKE